MTLVVCGSLSGNVLPFQLIYQGKTAASMPKVNFPKEWHVTATENHWSNEEKTKEYIEPYIEMKGLIFLPHFMPWFFLTSLKARPQSLFTNHWKAMLFMQ